MSDRPAAVVLVALCMAALQAPTTAHAWCPTLTEGPEQPRDYMTCAPELDRHRLFWTERCTEISLSSTRASTVLTTGEVTAVLRRSLDQWQTADCGSGATTGLDVAILAETNACTRATHYTRGPNVHSMTFIADREEWEITRMQSPVAFAVTYVWHERTTGEIYDADIEINESRGGLQICPDGGCDDCPPEGCRDSDAVDLGNVLTHELGHYFGISHTTIDHADATMFAQAPFGEIIKRDLEADDIDAICSTYPPGRLPETCDPVPMGGLGLDCVAPSSCGCAAPGAGPAGLEISFVLAGLALVLARRRRS